MEPSADDIQSFLAFAIDYAGAVPRSTAVTFLQNNSNDVNSAAGAFIENPDPKRYDANTVWDESLWENDKYGPLTKAESEIPYGGLHPDNGTHGSILAPSRPPSRMSYSVVQQEELQDWNENVKSRSPSRNQASTGYEDQMAEALKRSMDPGEQITGVTEDRTQNSHSTLPADRSADFMKAWCSAWEASLSEYMQPQSHMLFKASSFGEPDGVLQRMEIPLDGMSHNGEISLYDVLDGVFLGTPYQASKPLDDWLETPRSAIGIRLVGKNTVPSLVSAVRAPGNLCTSRYLSQNAGKSVEMSVLKERLMHAVNTINRKILRLTTFVQQLPSSSVPHNISKLLLNAIKRVQSTNTTEKQIINTGTTGKIEQGLTDIGSSPSLIADQLLRLHDSLQAQVTALQAQKPGLMASLQKISYGHTEIDEDVTEGSRATYTLTGIGTSQTADAMTIYAKHELKDIGDGISDGQAQWWKLSTFTTNGLTTRNLEAVTNDQLLTDMKSFHSEAIFLYTRGFLDGSLPYQSTELKDGSETHDVVGDNGVHQPTNASDVIDMPLIDVSQGEVENPADAEVLEAPEILVSTVEDQSQRDDIIQDHVNENHVNQVQVHHDLVNQDQINQDQTPGNKSSGLEKSE